MRETVLGVEGNQESSWKVEGGGEGSEGYRQNMIGNVGRKRKGIKAMKTLTMKTHTERVVDYIGSRGLN